MNTELLKINIGQFKEVMDVLMTFFLDFNFAESIFKYKKLYIYFLSFFFCVSKYLSPFLFQIITDIQKRTINVTILLDL